MVRALDSYPPAGGRGSTPPHYDEAVHDGLLLIFMYWVYVLYSTRFEKIYTGYTSDLEQRILSHHSLAKKTTLLITNFWNYSH